MYKMLFRLKKHAGFTLIELMVVIGVIGILSTIILVAADDVRKNARDKQRKVDLKNMELAFELYREANGRYPEGCERSAGPWKGGPGTGIFECDNSNDDYILNFSPIFIPELPHDEYAPTNSGYIYRTDTNGTGYKLLLYRGVESNFIESHAEEFSRCDLSCNNTACQTSQGSFPNSYAVYKDASPGDNAGPECY